MSHVTLTDREVLRRPVESGQYTSAEFSHLLAEDEMVESLSRRRQCYDCDDLPVLQGSA